MLVETGKKIFCLSLDTGKQSGTFRPLKFNLNLTIMVISIVNTNMYQTDTGKKVNIFCPRSVFNFADRKAVTAKSDREALKCLSPLNRYFQNQLYAH